LVVHEALALLVNLASDPLSALGAHQQQITLLGLACLVAVDPRVHAALDLLHHRQRHVHDLFLQLSDVQERRWSEGLGRIGSDDSPRPEDLLEVDDFLVAFPVFLDFLVCEERLAHVYLALVPHSEPSLAFIARWDVKEDLYRVFDYYALEVPVRFLLRVLEGPRESQRRLEGEGKPVLALADLLLAELESQHLVLEEGHALVEYHRLVGFLREDVG
jgi:hypothetical protein